MELDSEFAEPLQHHEVPQRTVQAPLHYRTATLEVHWDSCHWKSLRLFLLKNITVVWNG